MKRSHFNFFLIGLLLLFVLITCSKKKIVSEQVYGKWSVSNVESDNLFYKQAAKKTTLIFVADGTVLISKFQIFLSSGHIHNVSGTGYWEINPEKSLIHLSLPLGFNDFYGLDLEIQTHILNKKIRLIEYSRGIDSGDYLELSKVDEISNE